jgi:hypothetical protein
VRKVSVFKLEDRAAAATATVLVSYYSPLCLCAPLLVRNFLFVCSAAHRSQHDREIVDTCHLHCDWPDTVELSSSLESCRLSLR